MFVREMEKWNMKLINFIRNTNSHLITKLLWVFAILGSSLKILPVSVFDEMMLIIYSIHNGIKNGFSIKIDIWTITVIYFLIISLVGVYVVGIEHSNPNIIRYVVIGVALLFYKYDGKTFGRAIFITALLYLLITLALPYVGNLANLGNYWWQESNFWTGTSAAALVIYYSVLIVLIFVRNNPYKVAFTVSLLFLISNLIDSRLLIGFSIITLLLVFFIKHNSIKKYIIQGLIVIFSFVIFLFPMTHLNKKNVIIEYEFLKKTGMTETISFARNIFNADIGINNDVSLMMNYLKGYLTADNNSKMDDEMFYKRDLDRKPHWLVISNLYKKDKLHFIFGHGMLSSQYDLLDYVPKNKLSDNRIRSIGITTVIFNGGIVLVLLLLFSALWATFKIAKKAIELKAPYFVALSCLSIPMVSIFILPFTANILDMVLLWLAIAPKGLGYILLTSNNANK